MGELDVSTEFEVRWIREPIARMICDPHRTREWRRAFRFVNWLTDPPVCVGARFEIVLLPSSKRTYEVIDLVPGERLVMSSVGRSGTMETTYTWRDIPDPDRGGTLMTARYHGERKGLRALTTSIVAAWLRRRDERGLRRLVEQWSKPGY